jgi:hypothetical protein
MNWNSTRSFSIRPTTITSPYNTWPSLNADFAYTCWHERKIFHQYKKFRKRSPEKVSRGLGENEWIIVGSSLLRGWYGSQSTSSEHALNTIVVGWSDTIFLKLVRERKIYYKIWFRVQGFKNSVTWSARDRASCFHQWIDTDISSKW